MGAATLFVLGMGNVCHEVCPIGDGYRTKICPADGGGRWQPAGDSEVTPSSSEAWEVGVFLINYVLEVGAVLSGLS